MALLLALLGMTLAGAAGAQSPLPTLEPSTANEAPKDDPLAPAAIEARLAAVRHEIAESDRPGDAGASDTPMPTAERESLDAIESLLSAQLAIARRLAAVEPPSTARPSGEPAASAGGGASIFTLNALYEAKDAGAKAAGAGSEAVDAARTALDAAREAAEEADRARRQARAELDAAAGTAREAARESLRTRELASRLATEEVQLRRLELRARKRKAAAGEGDGTLDAQIEAVRSELRRSSDESDPGWKHLLEGEAELRRERELRERQLATIELRIKTVEAQYARDDAAGDDLLALAESLSAQRDILRHEITLIDARIQRLEASLETWRSWRSLFVAELPGEQRAAEATRMRNRVAELEGAAQRLEIRVAAQGRIAESLDERLLRLAPGTPLHTAVADHRIALARLRDAEQASLDEITADLRVSRRYLADLAAADHGFDPVAIAEGAYREVRSLWDYEITSIDDASITVGSLVLALALMALGLWASQRLAAFVARVAEQRFRLDVGASQSIQTLLFYLLMASFALLALRAVHFPLTAFTFLGGALAIGVGFGSQNVMNNFISGLILMLERPVRAHDTIEVDGSFGTIERIGARSTQIRSTDGRHIIVPNSFFLETNVVNWTLSDDLIRTSVIVGVIYGSPTRLVEQLIRQVVDELPDILPEPEPIILFDEFGDNSLNFEVHFWLRARGPMQKQIVESRVRFAIDDLFREHGLVIAFPQRDVHLDSVKPIEVRMVGAEPE